MSSTLHSQIILDQQPQAVTEKIINTHHLIVHPSATPGSVLILTKLIDLQKYGL